MVRLPEIMGYLGSVPRTLWITYVATLAIYAFASQFPELRLWGMSHYGYLSSAAQWFLVLGLLAAPLLLGSKEPEPENLTPNADHFEAKMPWLIGASLLTAAFGAAFYFLRARTFFLGDGYTILSLMARETPLIKYRELGETLAHIWVMRLVGENTEQAALTAHQIVSIGAGVLFVAVILVGAGFLFNRSKDRRLFSLGMLSGGYMLTYFGYVENYSLFVLSVAVFVIIGLLASKDLLNGWWLVVPLALGVFFHVLALTLLPSAVYLWSTTTSIGKRFRRLRARTRFSVHAVTLLACTFAFYHFYTSTYIVPFVLLSIVADRFTIDGYTLFSLDHFIDYGNLIILLCPGILVVAASAGVGQVRRALQLPSYRFLALVIATTLGAMFFIDPKLGMPRDWDLFSFCGVPLVAAGILFLIDHRADKWCFSKSAILVILLGIVSLGVRATNLSQPFVGAQIAVDYSKLDVRKGVAWRRVIQDFYIEQGSILKADAEHQRFYRDFPEFKLNDKGLKLLKAGLVAEAEALFQRSLDVNPLFVAAHQNLAKCYLREQQYQKAVETLELAASLAPDNSNVFSLLGQAYIKIDANDRAEKAWKNSLRLLPDQPRPLVGLLNLYRSTRQEYLFYKCLFKMAALDDTPVEYSLQVAEYHLRAGAIAKAADALKHGMTKGLDSTSIESFIVRYPALRDHL